MRRGTTPTFTLKVANEKFIGCTVYVTFRQGQYELTKSGDDVIREIDGDGCKLYVYLTQRETLEFENGLAGIQIRCVDSDGVARASKIKEFKVDPVLLEGVIDYAGD